MISMKLGPRERQILDILYRFGEAGVAQVREQIPNPPTYSAVRGMLALLERKGLVRHRQDKLRYVYAPTTPRNKAALSALRYMVATFFGGSTKDAMAALLDISDAKLTQNDLDRLRNMVRQAREQGR
ncbi:MAG: BlaI/MecI/CopY family transcriptional regulator [Acidobacteriia bacterium]|nr:BlaI/MecI/CopY family transcriptional regulator [Terriglobia bacterium]